MHSVAYFMVKDHSLNLDMIGVFFFSLIKFLKIKLFFCNTTCLRTIQLCHVSAAFVTIFCSLFMCFTFKSWSLSLFRDTWEGKPMACGEWRTKLLITLSFLCIHIFSWYMHIHTNLCVCFFFSSLPWVVGHSLFVF